MEYVFLTEEPDYYEGYLYKVTVHCPGPMRFYIGSKKGKLDYIYPGSPETNMKKYFADVAKYGATMHILECGNHADMTYLENKMLKEVDARNNPEYYNGSNVSGHNKAKWNSILVDEIYDTLKAREYRIETHPKDEVIDMEAFQIRHKKLDTGHVADIRDQMDSTEGKWLDNKDPTTVLEDWFGPGKHYKIGGIHTGAAAKRCRYVSELDVQYIPKSKWSKLGESDIGELAAMLNPQETDVKLAETPEEAEDWIVEQFFERDIEPDSEYILDRLQKRNWTKAKIKRGLVPKAKKKISKKELWHRNQLFIDWATPERQKKLNIKINDLLIRGIYAKSRSSGFLRGLGDDIVDAMLEHYENGWTDIFHIKILIHHPDPVTKKKFENELQKEYNNKFDMLKKMSEDKKGRARLEISFETLPLTEDSPLLDSVE